MDKFCISIFVCLSILSNTACTNSKGIRIPDPKSYELKGSEYFIVLKSGEVFKTEEIRVFNDTLYFNESAIHIKNAKAIETRSISPLKTLGLVAGVGGAVFVIGISYLYFLVAYGRASEK